MFQRHCQLFGSNEVSLPPTEQETYVFYIPVAILKAARVTWQWGHFFFYCSYWLMNFYFSLDNTSIDCPPNVWFYLGLSRFLKSEGRFCAVFCLFSKDLFRICKCGHAIFAGTVADHIWSTTFPYFLQKCNKTAAWNELI